MSRLTTALAYFVRLKIATDEAWSRIRVVLSGAEV